MQQKFFKLELLRVLYIKFSKVRAWNLSNNADNSWKCLLYGNRAIAAKSRGARAWNPDKLYHWASRFLVNLPRFLKTRLWRFHPWPHRKYGTIKDGKCFEFGRAFTKWKWTFEKKRMVPLVYLIYLLNISVKRKWTFFGFTYPLMSAASISQFDWRLVNQQRQIYDCVFRLFDSSKYLKTLRSSISHCQKANNTILILIILYNPSISENHQKIFRHYCSFVLDAF